MSKVRDEVLSSIALGPLPDHPSATAEQLALIEQRLSRISRPVSSEEARLLATCFGTDELHGLAWGLRHLIETTPDGPELDLGPPLDQNTPWVRTMKMRSAHPRARTVP